MSTCYVYARQMGHEWRWANKENKGKTGGIRIRILRSICRYKAGEKRVTGVGARNVDVYYYVYYYGYVYVLRRHKTGENVDVGREDRGVTGANDDIRIRNT